jgi:hypothetical protein
VAFDVEDGGAVDGIAFLEHLAIDDDRGVAKAEDDALEAEFDGRMGWRRRETVWGGVG